MFNFDYELSQINKIHFIGIGGVSMSGIALLLKENGYQITGSDRSESKYLANLYKNGIEITIGQKASNITDQDLFVYTDAILPDNEELIAAKATGKPVISRGKLLGDLMKFYNKSIAVSGAHGKSSTTSMLSKILVDANADASILLGGMLDDIGGNVLVGKSGFLLSEACEFKGNILYYHPSTAIVLNIDADHLDYYRDLDHIIDTFCSYMDNLTEDSIAIINADDPNTQRLFNHVKGKLITFGESKDADYRIENIRYTEDAFPRFDLVHGDKVMPLELNTIGDFNIFNAAAAAIASLENGIEFETIQKSLKDYKPLHRRLETIGQYKGAKVLTDYAHHPVEIQSCLTTVKKINHNKFITVFQPHTYSRTKALLDEFADSFYNTDEVIVTEIYAAREKFDPTIKSEDLVEKLVENGVNAIYIKTFEEAEEYLKNKLVDGDLLLTTGCGNPDVLAEMMVEED